MVGRVRGVETPRPCSDDVDIALSREQGVKVLDLCCGPGDVGPAVFRQYPSAEIDFVDRDPFLISICRGVNRRDAIPGRILIADLVEDGWDREARVVREIYARLRSGGVLVFTEPASAEAVFGAGFAAWKADQPPRYTRENWQRFWLRGNAILGYDHVALMGERQPTRIDEQMTPAGWSRLIQEAEFPQIDILWRDADQVIIAALKP
jgi:SAM-dependent methyltransferase